MVTRYVVTVSIEAVTDEVKQVMVKEPRRVVDEFRLITSHQTKINAIRSAVLMLTTLRNEETE